jgi:hypothetical protein
LEYFIIIIINYCINIPAYYKYIINAQYNNYITDKGLLEECDKEENVAATGAATTSCLKRGL